MASLAIPASWHTLCPSLSLARRRHSLWAALVVLGVKHCSCCPFPGFCDSVGPSHNCEAGVLHHKMGSCLVGWAGTFVLIAISRMPVPLESSDLAGITQQADTTRNPTMSIPKQYCMSWHVTCDQGQMLLLGRVTTGDSLILLAIKICPCSSQGFSSSSEQDHVPGEACPASEQMGQRDLPHLIVQGEGYDVVSSSACSILGLEKISVS